MGRKVKDLTGMRFGKLTVLEYDGIYNHKAHWKCKCDCGNITVKKGWLLLAGKTRSCGCLAVNNTDQTTHGMSKTHLYGVWGTMKSRCYNPNSQRYSLYGGRGITVCEEWRNDFTAFVYWAMTNGYQEGMTLERKDNNGNYEPSNCCWTNQKAQCNNRRNNAVYTCNGKTLTLAQWAEETGINYGTLWSRLHRDGWSIERAVSTKV